MRPDVQWHSIYIHVIDAEGYEPEKQGDIWRIIRAWFRCGRTRYQCRVQRPDLGNLKRRGDRREPERQERGSGWGKHGPAMVLERTDHILLEVRIPMIEV